jgi:cell division protein FtsL
MRQEIGKKSEVLLELTLGLIVTVILLVGIVKIFVWVNDRMVQRDIDYNNTRVDAASEETEGSNVVVVVNEEGYPQLDIFGN